MSVAHQAARRVREKTPAIKTPGFRRSKSAPSPKPVAPEFAPTPRDFLALFCFDNLAKASEKHFEWLDGYYTNLMFKDKTHG